MDYCEIKQPKVYTDKIEKWNNDTDASGSEMAVVIQDLTNNDAYLKEQVERLDGNKLTVSEKGIPNGVATLGTDGKLTQHVDYGHVDNAPSTIVWDKITGKPATYPATSHTHNKSEVGLGNVDNTADVNKNVNYAASAGNADTLDGMHAAAFSLGSHSHAYTSITDRPTGLDSGYVRTGQKAGTTIGSNATAEGGSTIASSQCCHAEGLATTASANQCHAEGQWTTASGSCGHAEGKSTTASGICSHAEGQDTTASGTFSHAKGNCTTASGTCSYAGGSKSEAKGNDSFSHGSNIIANDYQFVIGTYNVEKAPDGVGGDRFIVGSGWGTRKNCLRAHSNGQIYSAGAYNTSGADYAEYFEWTDGPQKEDRVGYFVTLDGDRIKIASPGDYILGLISSIPSVIGNSYDDQWGGMELLDDWGRPILEEYTEPAEYKEVEKEDGTIEQIMIHPEMSGMRPKINPDYDNTQPYIGRSRRPEWSPVGMLGVLRVRDDGTCKVNGYCTVADGGIATASGSGWRVIARVTDSIIKIVFK